MRVLLTAILLVAACSGSGKPAVEDPGDDTDTPKDKPAAPADCQALTDEAMEIWQPDRAGPDVSDLHEPAKKHEARMRLRARQAEVCEDMCVRMTTCVCEDAAKNDPSLLVDDGQVAPEKLLAKNAEQCMSDCNGEALMTPDQRKRLVACFSMDACGDFVPCTQKALSSP